MVAACIWNDGINDCNDGERYTSDKPQPYPFHRRWCSWPKKWLTYTSIGSLVMLGWLMDDWKHALVFCTLPGFWFAATHPTTVDAPAMLLALLAALLFPIQPWVACLLACLSGVIHERGPVFAALYAWHPLLLVGLVAVGWWRKAAPPDGDALVGRGLLQSLTLHKPFHDWLGTDQNVFALRGLPLMAAYFGESPQAWAALAVAWCSRLVGTDLGRFAFWAAPIMVRELPDFPAWMAMTHAVTFKRMA